MSESVLVPLSALDQNGVETSSITFGYILKTTTYDSKALDAAAGRLAEKWRLIAGRLEWDAQVNSIILLAAAVKFMMTAGKNLVHKGAPGQIGRRSDPQIYNKPVQQTLGHSSDRNRCNQFDHPAPSCTQELPPLVNTKLSERVLFPECPNRFYSRVYPR